MKQDIAREVVRRRIAAGMTQQELARRVGVRPETISRLEWGNTYGGLRRWSEWTGCCRR